MLIFGWTIPLSTTESPVELWKSNNFLCLCMHVRAWKPHRLNTCRWKGSYIEIRQSSYLPLLIIALLRPKDYPLIPYSEPAQGPLSCFSSLWTPPVRGKTESRRRVKHYQRHIWIWLALKLNYAFHHTAAFIHGVQMSAGHLVK